MKLHDATTCCPLLLVSAVLLLEVLVADAMVQLKPKQELHRGHFLQTQAQNKACMQKQKIRLPNTTVVVARTELESLDWSHQLAGIPYELETEFSPACKYPSLKQHEVKKPRTYTGSTLQSSLHHPGSSAGTTYECGGFLNFIVDEYERLPKVSAFVHGNPRGDIHEGSHEPHGDPHIFSVIRHIAADPSKVVGYCSLNSKSTWDAPGFGGGFGWKETKNTWKEAVRYMDPLRFGHLIAALTPMLQGEKTWMCFDSAQFAVSRERIHAHPLAFYQELLDWVRDADVGLDWLAQDWTGTLKGVSAEELKCGMLETAWHRIFGEASVCPRNKDRCAIGYGLDHR